LENIVSYLPDWRKSMTNFQAVPWHYFVDHVRMNINPLAADDHMKEIIQQLQLMGEVKESIENGNFFVTLFILCVLFRLHI